MGEAHSISLSSGSTPAEAPEAPEVKVSAIIPQGISIPTDQEEDEEALATEEAEESSRPDWLPEKFNDAEAMAKAYKELEGRLGQSEAPEDAEEAGEQEATIPEGVGTNALQPFYDEFAESGELKEESFASLEKMGLQRELVQAFMEGQRASHQAELSQIYEAAGGKESYTTALDWAVSALSPEEIAAYNVQMETGDAATAKMAVLGMMARYHQSGHSGNKQPRLLQSEPVGPGGPAAYESLEQVMTDMRSDLYKQDSAFRTKVRDKLARSDVMG
ncbi:hypothetical protein CMI37_27475 [Candidatus Pacearchaeota archaeon]|nr:hypothetical protein [Candidatus Pacearchaeota archaeon]|tara:strand:- start:744 stop:1568 length:825 start_codon:yes stop_codon:yes gene_type:complete